MVLQDLAGAINRRQIHIPYLEKGTEGNKSVRKILRLLNTYRDAGPRVELPSGITIPATTPNSPKRPKNRPSGNSIPATGEPTTTGEPTRPYRLPRVAKARPNRPLAPRVPKPGHRIQTRAVPTRPVTAPRVPKEAPTPKIYSPGTIIRKRFPEDNRYYEGEVKYYDSTNKWYKIKYLDGMEEDYDEEEMKRYYKPKQKYAKTQYDNRALQIQARYDTCFNYSLFPKHKAYATGGTIWDPELNKMAHYRDLFIHPNPEIQRRWMESGENEFGRLFQGYKEVNGMDVLEWIHHDEVPKDKIVTYARYTVAFRPEKLEKYRTRITAGGDRLPYDGDVATYTASLETVKLVINSTISTPGARMFTGDVGNMYLYSLLKNPEYVRFKADQIPPNIIEKYNLTAKIHNGYIYAKVKKAWYGLKQSGRIAHEDLVKHLAKHGYTKVPFTECLFKHKERDIAFALVVDDFAVKYTNKEDADHLIAAMNSKYPFKVDWEAKQFIGINMKWDYEKGEVELSMDGYVEQALKELQHAIPKQHHYAPSKATDPVYGQKVQYATVDESEILNKALATFIHKVTGKFLYYARAIDITMQHALNDIASSKKTQDTLKATKYFLDYAGSNPNGKLIFRRSEMILQGDSDAAYLVCPQARSRAGGYIFVGNKDKKLFNGPVMVIAKIIKNVMASAAEAEVAALFLTAQEMVPLRQCLIDLGHPQPATPLKTDNSTAKGIVTGTIKQKRSKAIDMRFYWLRDRVKQGQFNVYWEPGQHNLADYVTKHHPSTHHKRLRPIYMYNKDTSPSTVQGCIKILNSARDTTRPKVTVSTSDAYPLTKNIKHSPGKAHSIFHKIQSKARRASHSNPNRTKIAHPLSSLIN